MASLSFTRMATSTAATKRPATMSGGIRAAPVANLSSIACTPLDPVDAEVRQRIGLEGPHTVFESFVEGSQDILVGDIFTVESIDYDIKEIESWEWTRLSNTVVKRIFLEKPTTS